MAKFNSRYAAEQLRYLILSFHAFTLDPPIDLHEIIRWWLPRARLIHILTFREPALVRPATGRNHLIAHEQRNPQRSGDGVLPMKPGAVTPITVNGWP